MNETLLALIGSGFGSGLDLSGPLVSEDDIAWLKSASATVFLVGFGYFVVLCVSIWQLFARPSSSRAREIVRVAFGAATLTVLYFGVVAAFVIVGAIIADGLDADPPRRRWVALGAFALALVTSAGVRWAVRRGLFGAPSAPQA